MPYRLAAPLALLFLLTACVDPTPPEFQLEEPFYLAEGRILAGDNPSEVRLRASDFTESRLQLLPVPGAVVISQEAGGAEVTWTETEAGVYQPPAAFRARTGETWSFAIALPDGTQIASDPETIPAPVAVEEVTIRFNQESTFSSSLNRFIPRFELTLDYDDPADETNFYAYDYRYWEDIDVCISCERGILAGLRCVPNTINNARRYDYLCDTDECYRISAGGETRYGTDELSNGSAVRDFPLGAIPFEAYGGLLVEAQLLSITPEAHRYGRIIQDLTTGNTGLNAVTPAPLDGNVRNLDPAGRTVLGYLAAAAVATDRSWILRDFNTGTPLPFDNNIRLQPVPPPGQAPRFPCEIPGRTATRPAGWGE